MTRHLYLLLCALGFSALAHAQFYVELNAGYNFGTNGSTEFLEDYTETIFSNGFAFYSETSVEHVNLSMGKGVSFGGSAGYSFTD